MHCTPQADTNKCFAFKSATKLKSWGMSRRLTDVTMAAWLNGYGVGSLVLWGRVFTFSLKIPSFNFDIDSIYGLEATQHAQFQVEVETKLIFYGRILWGFKLCFKLCFSIVSGKAKKKGTMQCIEQVKDCYTERCWRLGLSYTATKEILCWFAMDFWFLCHEVHIPGMWKDMDIYCGRMHIVRVLGEMGKSTAGTNLESSACMCVAMRL